MSRWLNLAYEVAAQFRHGGEPRELTSQPGLSFLLSVGLALLCCLLHRPVGQGSQESFARHACGFKLRGLYPLPVRCWGIIGLLVLGSCIHQAQAGQ